MRKKSYQLQSGDAAPLRLRVMATTDLHLHLMSWDYYAECPIEGIGLEALAPVIEAARGEAQNTLLFDNGDLLQGTPLGDYLGLERGLADGEPHPAFAALEALGYDAMALGNHEFDYGLPFLRQAMARSRLPILCANLSEALGPRPREDRGFCAPTALLERVFYDDEGEAHRLKIGVVGLIPPQVVDWNRHQIQGALVARDMVEAGADWVKALRGQGADLVIGLAHTGIGDARYSPALENAAIPLARRAGFDAMVVGHIHQLFPSPVFEGQADLDVSAGKIAGVPAVMPGWRGGHLGLIDLTLQRQNRVWRVVGSASEARPTKRLAAPSLLQRKLTEAVAPLHDAALAACRRPAGHSSVALHSYFTFLGQTSSLALVAEAKVAHLHERLDAQGLPVLAAVAPFKSGGLAGPHDYTDIPHGALVERHLADLYAYPNSFVAIRQSGAELLEWLERSASVFNRILPGSTETLLRNPAYAGYQFEVLEQLDVVYDLTAPARYHPSGRLLDRHARRVLQASYRGQALGSLPEIILCTNNFRLGGAGGFLQGQKVDVLLDEGRSIVQILRDHIARGGNMIARREGSLTFKPIPATTALFETGPGARRHLREIAALKPVMRGTTPAGFLRMKIDLSGEALRPAA